VGRAAILHEMANAQHPRIGRTLMLAASRCEAHINVRVEPPTSCCGQHPAPGEFKGAWRWNWQESICRSRHRHEGRSPRS